MKVFGDDMRKFLAPLGFLALAACGTQTPVETPLADTIPSSQASDAAAQDPYLWLEDVEGDAALTWVRGQNERSLAELQADVDDTARSLDRLMALNPALSTQMFSVCGTRCSGSPLRLTPGSCSRPSRRRADSALMRCTSSCISALASA